MTGQSLISIEALELFQSLYAVEREIDERFEKNQTPLPRDAQIVRQIRQQKAKPIADRLYAWLQQKRLGTTKNADITKAIEYCLKGGRLLHIPVENEHLFRFKMNADSGLRVHRFRTPQCTYSDVR